MYSKISLVANGLTNSEKYWQISCGTDILVIFAVEQVTTIWKTFQGNYFKIKCLQNFTIHNYKSFE